MTKKALELLILIILNIFSHSVYANFVAFESGQVRPLAMSPDGTRLFAVNAPDNRLEIFNITPGGLTQAADLLLIQRKVFGLVSF